MNAYEPYVALAVALGVGLLIGMEREQADPDRGASRFLGGARTHPLFALAGAVSAMLAPSLGAWIVAAVFLAMMAPTLLSYYFDLRGDHDRGMTSEVAFAVTFLLGALAAAPGVLGDSSRRLILVAALGVAVTALLSAKPFLHRLVERTSKDDVYATLKFLIVAVIALPLLPNRTYGPLAVLNPFEIGLMIVLIAGIGFLGYVAARVMGGGKGLVLTGLIGGLVSSTSVTLSFSGRAKKHPPLAAACALAVVAASTVMFVRIIIAVAVVNVGLLSRVALPLGAMALGGAGYAGWMVLRSRREAQKKNDEAIALKNPFELGAALKFGLIYAAVTLVAAAATRYLGTGGTYLAGVLAGTTDVDAITLSMANQAKAGLDAQVATTTIMLGSVSNTLVKAGLAISLGGWGFGRQVLVGFGVAIGAGALGLVAAWLL